MDSTREYRAFVAVAEAESFAAAARRLNMSGPAMTRTIAALEDRLGARLFKRSTRVVRLTELGGRFLADCRRIIADIEAAEASVAGAHDEPRGAIVVTAPAMFGRLHVAPTVIEFLARYPGMTARTLFVDRVVDLIEEGVDVAVRIAHLPDSRLTAIRVGAVRRIVVATPQFLKQHGAPRTVKDLARFEVIDFSSALPHQSWTFRGRGRTQTAKPRVRLSVNSAEVAVAAAVAGFGLTRVLSYQAGREVEAGRLKVVLAEAEPPPIPVHLVHAEGRRTSARLRVFLDFAVERLKREKWLC
jgi:DNA-binding transcriptional LysR family regulator